MERGRILVDCGNNISRNGFFLSFDMSPHHQAIGGFYLRGGKRGIIGG